MIRYRLWPLAATLLLMSLSLVGCTGSPGGSNANGASPKPAEAAQSPSNMNAKPTPGPAPTTPGYEGFQDDVNCANLIGWAWDSRRPNEPVKVEIYDGNTLLATVTADAFRQDLLDARKGSGAHAFTYPLPAQLRDGKPHTLRAKIAGTDVDLIYTSKQITCKNE